MTMAQNTVKFAPRRRAPLQDPRAAFSARRQRESGPRPIPVQPVHPPAPEFSSEEFFGREPFTYGPGLRYYGTGFPGRGGPGFTGGYYGYSDEPPEIPTELEREYARYLYGSGAAPSWHSMPAEYNPYRSAVGGGGAQAAPAPVRRFPPGPKGYRRSDERIREDLCERIMQTGHIDSSEVTVDVKGGQVLLEGTMPERWMKHTIENLADSCPGVKDIENKIRVQPAAGTGTPVGPAAVSSPPKLQARS